MSARFWRHIAVAVRRLSPEAIRREADQPFSLALVGAEQELRHWSETLVPPDWGERKREQALRRFFPIHPPISPGYAKMLTQFDVVLVTPAAVGEVRPHTREYLMLPARPDEEGRWAEALMEEISARRTDLSVALARHYWPFRNAAVDRVIFNVARENAAFAILSALPNVIPSPIELPWAVGEFASDTAFITTNQFRMAFLIAAASDSPVGWREQKGQLASIAGSAFGLRALARELAGKLPAGGGLVAKGLIAYSATVAVGRGLDQFHRIGRHFTRAEKGQAYTQAFREGRRIVEELARRIGGRDRPPAAGRLEAGPTGPAARKESAGATGAGPRPS